MLLVVDSSESVVVLVDFVPLLTLYYTTIKPSLHNCTIANIYDFLSSTTVRTVRTVCSNVLCAKLILITCEIYSNIFVALRAAAERQGGGSTYTALVEEWRREKV